MAHRNTPNQETGISPAIALYGYAIRDHLPNHYRTVRKEWEDINNMREQALAKRHLKQSQIATPGWTMQHLAVGEAVSVQNQIGNKPLKWNNTGVIAEVLPHRQYRVVVDGSRRVTLRNRRFLRKINPICRRQNRTETPLVQREVSPPLPHESPTPEQVSSQDTANEAVANEAQRREDVHPPHHEHVAPVGDVEDTTTIQPSLHEADQVRRSTRVRRPPNKLNL